MFRHQFSTLVFSDAGGETKLWGQGEFFSFGGVVGLSLCPGPPECTDKLQTFKPVTHFSDYFVLCGAGSMVACFSKFHVFFPEKNVNAGLTCIRFGSLIRASCGWPARSATSLL